MDSSGKASATIPFLYRFLLLNVEPLFALNGAILLCLKAGLYASVMTRGAVAIAHPSAQFIYTEVAGGWLHLAFTEGIILRLVDDLRIWKLVCGAILLSDIMYCQSCAEALGGWSVWLNVMEWTVADWVISLSTYPFLLVRLAIVLGIGVKQPKADARKQ